MKVASKVFIIIPIVVAVIAILAGGFFILESLSSSGADYDNVEVLTKGLALLIAALIILIIGSIALHKINKAKTKSQLIGIGIVTMLFCSFLGGLFMLLISDEDLQKSQKV